MSVIMAKIRTLRNKKRKISTFFGNMYLHVSGKCSTFAPDFVKCVCQNGFEPVGRSLVFQLSTIN